MIDINGDYTYKRVKWSKTSSLMTNFVVGFTKHILKDSNNFEKLESLMVLLKNALALFKQLLYETKAVQPLNWYYR